MEKFCQCFLKTGIDLAPFGIERREENIPYFCTPKGADVIGWTGGDGIHYCFVRGFGGMVFAVSPMNGGSDCVHPVAENFADFLRLLIACGGESAIEQAWQWSREQFDAFLQEYPPSDQAKAVSAQITEKLGLQPMDDPWGYIMQVQQAFDYTRIPYSEDYYDEDMNPDAKPQPPEWKVYFDGNFWGYSGQDRAGQEITVGKSFQWAGREWLIPAVYLCGKGLVVDFCMRVPADEIRAFLEKWEIDPETEQEREFSQQEQMQIDLDNPLCFDIRPVVLVNGRELKASHGSGLCYNPVFPQGIGDESKWVAEHYALDPTAGWTVSRWCFAWATSKKPAIRELSVTMWQQPRNIPGPHFTADKPGDTFTFVCPSTGERHTLTVQEIQSDEISSERDFMPGFEFPSHYRMMTYTITPKLPDGAVHVFDCAESDQPRQIQSVSPEYPYQPQASIGCAIGIIGGADGPTAIMVGVPEGAKVQTACSSLHFEPTEKVEWRLTFREEPCGEMTIKLI